MGEMIRKQVDHSPLNNHTCAGVISAGSLFPESFALCNILMKLDLWGPQEWLEINRN